MTIELYTWNTPNGRKSSVALEEMGLPYHVTPIDITKGAQFESPDGHPKLLHLWPVKLLQTGRSDGDYTGVAVMREAASFKR